MLEFVMICLGNLVQEVHLSLFQNLNQELMFSFCQSEFHKASVSRVVATL